MKKLVFLTFLSFTICELQAQKFNLVVGTYTSKGTSEGIYVYDYNSKDAVAQLKSTTKAANPSYVALSKDQRFIYAVNETGSTSTVSAFSFNKKTGQLSLLNTRSSEGADPCYVLVDEQNVFLANYSGGTIAVYGRNADGSLTKPKQVLKHTGKSIDPKRQLSAHVHQVQFTPDKKYLIANDLGEDQLYIYAYHPRSAKVLTQKAIIKTTAGAGPRHLAFTPNGKFAYLAHEFTGTVSAYAYSNGTLKKIQELGSIEAGFKGAVDAADIHVSADGKFLYESNRGDANTVAVYNISPNGRLKLVEIVSTLGKGPRNFAIEPSGNFLLVAHQYTDEVVIFNRNRTTGKLTDSGKRIKVGAPVCLVFAKP
jgi:6-phosphogluconolactonase